MNQSQNHPKPFSAERTKMIVCRVIYFYSVFYVIMKVIGFFQHLSILPHVIIVLPFLMLGIWGYQNDRRKTYSWLYVIIGIVVISTIRYFELDWILKLEQLIGE